MFKALNPCTMAVLMELVFFVVRGFRAIKVKFK
jgi:hypothetical protein